VNVAKAQSNNALCNLEYVVEIVADDDDGNAFGCDALKPNLVSREFGGRQRSGWFVELDGRCAFTVARAIAMACRCPPENMRTGVTRFNQLDAKLAMCCFAFSSDRFGVDHFKGAEFRATGSWPSITCCRAQVVAEGKVLVDSSRCEFASAAWPSGVGLRHRPARGLPSSPGRSR